MEGFITATVHGDGIIFWEDSVSGQCSLVLCQDPLFEATAKILHRVNPVAKLILGAGKLLLCIIIAGVVPKLLVHELFDASISPKVKIIIKESPIFMHSAEL